jgi:hypothetical protein
MGRRPKAIAKKYPEEGYENVLETPIKLKRPILRIAGPLLGI